MTLLILSFAMIYSGNYTIILWMFNGLWPIQNSALSRSCQKFQVSAKKINLVPENFNLVPKKKDKNKKKKKQVAEKFTLIYEKIQNHAENI